MHYPIITLILLVWSLTTHCGLLPGKSPVVPGDLEFPPELVNLVPYPQNPVFTGTGMDTWDKHIRERGYIFREAGLWRLWYTGYNKDRSDTMFLGYATSPDGFAWTRYPGNPVYAESWVEDMCVVKHDSLYYMFAEGLNDIAHLMTSQDGVHWTNLGDLDVRYCNGEPLSAGPYGTPAVWIEGDTWYLYYERKDLGIWLAASKDLTVWTNVQDDPVIAMGPGPYDNKQVAMNQVFRYKGRYYCNYHAFGDKPWNYWSENLAVSDDLVHWTKYSGNPFLRNGKSSGVYVTDGDGYRFYTMHPDVCVYFPRGR